MNNLMIYGSYARNDFKKDSDIDLLALTNELISKKIIKNNINLSVYSIQKFEEMINIGSLFIYHLKTEGKILYDENNLLNDLLYKKFTLKINYNMEISFSYNLIKEIISIYSNINDITFAHSKIIWSLRTVFSAIGAEKEIPIFSTKSILNEFGKDAIKYLEIKKINIKNKSLIIKLRDFVKDIIKNRNLESIKYSNDLEIYKNNILNKLKNKDQYENVDFY